MPGIREQLQPLELLDLKKCDTVGKIVDGLSRCSFGGRMLGEVCLTIQGWIDNGLRPVIINDGASDVMVMNALQDARDYFDRPITSEEFSRLNAGHHLRTDHPVLVVGHVCERYLQFLFDHGPRVIWLNDTGQAKPGQIQDGFFPDAVFADPGYVLTVLSAVLQERRGGKAISAKRLMGWLNPLGGLSSEVAHGYRTLKAMVDDPDCTVFMTMSGAMTIAKMGLVICDMIDHKMVNYLASTGALIAHGLVESVGLKHYKHDPRFTDEQLGDEKLNRVTDTLEPEENLDDVATVIGKVLDGFDGDQPICPSILNRQIGMYLADQYPGQRGILKSAYLHGVPVVIPAFVDSEVGNDVYVHNRARRTAGKNPILMDMELDSETLLKAFTRARRRGIFSIGGGVPRNNTQNVAPLIEITNARLGTRLPEATFDTGCRICPDPMWYGHLSGCTYSENASWRKMDPRAIQQGKFAEVHGDATMILPFLIRAIMDELQA